MLHLINKRQLFIASTDQFFQCAKGRLGHVKDWIQSYPFIITGTFISYTLNAKTSSQKTKSKKDKKKERLATEILQPDCEIKLTLYSLQNTGISSSFIYGIH